MGISLAESFNEFKGKKVFVTGHTGFKGFWLSSWLQNLGALVKGYSLQPQYTPNLYSLKGGGHLTASEIGDIRNFNSLSKSIRDFQPDIIFHLAAQPLVRYSYINPLETYETNVMGTAHVLESLKLIEGACIVVVITTDKVYLNNEWYFPYREVDRLGGYDPYSSSKACSELVVDSYRNAFFHPSKVKDHQKRIFSARAGNVIGGGDWSMDRLVPDIVRQLQEGTEIVIRNPTATRPWQHVMEPLAGYLSIAQTALQKPETFIEGAWNFGPDPSDNLKVIEIVKMAILSWGTGTFKIQSDINAPHEAGILSLDISKARNTLSWHPKMDAAKAVQLTMDWYKQFYAGIDPMELIFQNINIYTSIK